MTVRCKSGLKGWRQRLRSVYSSLEEFVAWCDLFDNHTRLGYTTPEEAWDVNPMIEGSVKPSDYRMVHA